MNLFSANAPHPLRVNIFLAEKGLELPTVWLDVLNGDTRTGEHLTRNSLGETPVLELDDGTFLSESTAICRYLESIYPERPLMGRNPLHAAKVEMWARRMEQQICAPLGDFGLHTFPIFSEKVEQNPTYAESCLRLQDKRWVWFDSELADGRTFVVDNELSYADIAGATALMVSSFVDHPIPKGLKNANRWADAVRGLKGW
ncbi:MAG: glutathione S-transferase N-terminal domain-containing protein [Woeseiaceae bacterium]|nr:glutathione S-transferase N-terminal domain-containing protein [Woeseiaceae bacterium]